MAVLDLGKVVPEKGVDYFTESDVNQIVDDVVDEITIPTKVSELENDSEFIDKEANNLTYYTLATNTGSLIELSINSSTYVMTMNLKNAAGTVISTGTVDLPLESVVVNGSYDSVNKKIVLTLQGGSTIDVPVGDLVSGLQSEITTTNKLSSDLVDDTNQTNKFVTTSEKTTWGNKYDKPSGGIPSTDLSSAVQTSLGKADSAIQDVSDKQDLLVSGTNIKTINNTSLLGSGNIDTEIIQFSTMPTANADNLGKIVQFIGTTDSTYTNGYFYKCISDGAVTPTYSWENINVQASSGGSVPDYSKFLFNTYVDGNRVIIDCGIDMNSLSYGSHTAIKNTITDVLNNPDINGKSNIFLVVKFVDAWFCTVDGLDLTSDGYKSVRYKVGTETNKMAGTSSFSVTRTNGVVTNNGWSNTIFNNLPLRYLGLSNTTSYTPTANSYNPATTKYVDDKVASSSPSHYIVGDYLIYTLSVGNYKVTPSSSSWSSNTGLPLSELTEAITLAYNNSKKLILNIYTTNSVEFVSYFFATSINTTSTSLGGTAHLISTNGNICEATLNLTYSYSNNAFDVSGTSVRATSQLSIGTSNTYAYTPTQSTHPATKGYVDNIAIPTSVTNAETTYTISSLTGNYSYKLGEITSLTITTSTSSDLETLIYFESGSTPTDISMPDTITNLGDAPTMTTASNVNTGTCEASKNYIISVLNNIAFWKAY